YRGLAEVAEKYLKKGNSVYVEGKLRTRMWEDDKGEKRYVTEIEAQNLTMLGGGNGGRKPETPAVEKGEPVLPSVPAGLDKDEAFYDPSEDALPF
ncbi:MAG: single-stranded DNA-binding protein, partial [Bacteroidales bacterium]|nr:single-stranded DNA-binding protein [Bacteroidales bacterium]